MALRNLPVLQNWDCHVCGNCCREYEVEITEDERRRIEAQGWDSDLEMAGVPLFRKVGPPWARRTHLRRRPEEGCVFLTADGRCRIHARFGLEAKPLACRLYPFVLVPVGDHWRVGTRFACPSAAGNRGRPVAEHTGELNAYVKLVQRQESAEQIAVPPPPLQRGQSVAWDDLYRFVEALLRLLRHDGDRVERRWRKCLALASLCRPARFDKISGARLGEFLNVVLAGLDDEVPRNPVEVPAPGWVGRMLFRQLAGAYSRKDRGPQRGAATRSRLTRLWSGWRFARGHGPVPQTNRLLMPTTFEQMETPTGPLPAAVERMLERYSLVKVESLQFCGPTNFGLPFWDGLESLALTLPIVLWLSRGLKAGTREEAIAHALGIVDDHFGYNRVFRAGHYRMATRLLARRGELDRLIAWYGR